VAWPPLEVGLSHLLGRYQGLEIAPKPTGTPTITTTTPFASNYSVAPLA
jgi:hypothetical protein